MKLERAATKDEIVRLETVLHGEIEQVHLRFGRHREGDLGADRPA
jgi:hypothetical protein